MLDWEALFNPLRNPTRTHILLEHNLVSALDVQHAQSYWTGGDIGLLFSLFNLATEKSHWEGRRKYLFWSHLRRALSYATKPEFSEGHMIP